MPAQKPHPTTAPKSTESSDALGALFDEKPTQGDALGALIAAVRAAATDPNAKPRDAGLDVLEHVAEVGDGVMLLADLGTAGFSRAVVAALLTQGDDKRIKPRLALGLVAGHEVVWLRSAGWQAVGKANRREAAPTDRSLRHRLSPYTFDRAMRERVAPAARRGGDVLLDVVRGAPLTAYVETRTGDAWNVVKQGRAEQAADASTVLGGVFPDAIISESWPLERVGTDRLMYWPSTGHPEAHVAPQPSEWIVAVEVELSGKAAPLVQSKVRQHDVAMRLGWWQAVVWITDDRDTLTRLLRAGVGTHPGHYLLSAATVGIGGDPAVLAQVERAPMPWWSQHL